MAMTTTRPSLVESKKRNAPRRRIGDELLFIRSEQQRIATERRIDRDLPEHIIDDLRTFKLNLLETAS